jgi:hypothetical protein
LLWSARGVSRQPWDNVNGHVVSQPV